MKIIISLLFIIVAASYVRGMSIGKCVDQLTASVTANSVAVCSAMSEYMQCLMKGLDLSALDNNKLNILKNQLNSQLSSVGVSCNIDLQKLVRELQEEERQVTGSTTTKRPPTFEEATSLGQCIDAMINVTIRNSGEIWCSNLNPYVKCLLRVQRLQLVQMSREQLRTFQDQMEEGLRIHGISCTFDAQKIIDELRGKSGNDLDADDTSQKIIDEPGKSGSDGLQNVHVVFTALVTLFSIILANI